MASPAKTFLRTEYSGRITFRSDSACFEIIGNDEKLYARFSRFKDLPDSNKLREAANLIPRNLEVPAITVLLYDRCLGSIQILASGVKFRLTLLKFLFGSKVSLPDNPKSD